MGLKRIDTTSTPLSILIDEESVQNSGGVLSVDMRSLTSPEVITIRDLDDFDDRPRIDGSILLETGTTYKFLGDVDFGTSTMIATGPVAMLGGGSDTTTLRTSSATPLLRMRGATATIDMRDLSMVNSVGECVLFETLTPSAAAERTINASGVNFTGTGDVVRFQDGAFAIFRNCAWLNCDGDLIVIDRQILGCVVNDCGARSSADGSRFLVGPATLTVGTRIRVTLSSISSPLGGYGLSIDAGATIPDEALVVMGVNFNGVGDAVEPGTLDSNSVKSYFKTNLGVESTYPRAAYAMDTSAPVAATLNTPVKLAGVTVDLDAQLFDFPTDNRARYIGSKPRRFIARADATIVTTSNAQIVRLNFAVNDVVNTDYKIRGQTSKGGGVRIEGLVLHAVVNLNPGDYIELWGTDETSTDTLEWTDGQVILTEIGG